MKKSMVLIGMLSLAVAVLVIAAEPEVAVPEPEVAVAEPEVDPTVNETLALCSENDVLRGSALVAVALQDRACPQASFERSPVQASFDPVQVGQNWERHEDAKCNFNGQCDPGAGDTCCYK